ncbi:MAG: cell division protein FtsA [Draconibacterium sp.]|nr:cell division protein FtsA [Draconibacterium sp.]
MTSKNNLSVVLDIGTSKIVAIAGLKNELGKVEVFGVANTISKGIKRGVVFNIDEAAKCIKKTLSLLESQIDEDIFEVNIAYSGQFMKTIDFHNRKDISDKGLVSEFDVDQLYNEAKNVEFEQEYKIIQVIPTSFVIDNESTVLNPAGTTGREIIANYKLVVIPEVYITNLQLVFEKIGVELGEITLSSLAVSEAVITEEEKEMGAIVLDIGAGITNLAIYHDNMLIHTAVIPFGGGVVTKDIKEGCSILLKWAEQLKVKYGEALGDFADDQKVVTIPVHSNLEAKEISFRSLAYIIQARMEEILDSVNSEIEKSGIADQLGAGIVLTGGTSNLNNIVSLVKFRTGMDARIANLAFNPKYDKKALNDSVNFAALGLLNLNVNKSAIPIKETRSSGRKKDGFGIMPLVGKVVQGALGFFDDNNDDLAMN